MLPRALIPLAIASVCALPWAVAVEEMPTTPGAWMGDFQTRHTPEPGSVTAFGSEWRQLEHLGVERGYLIHFPNGAAPAGPAPLVLALHGAFTNAVITEGLTRLSPLSDAKGFVVVYPDGSPDGSFGVWDILSPALGKARPDGRRALGRDDLGYLAALIDKLVADGTADPRRIYVTGMSNGAYMATRMSVHLSDRIAAIAPVAGTSTKLGAFLAKGEPAMPMIYFHGVDDRVVGIDGSEFATRTRSSLSAEKLCAWFVRRNGLAGEPEIVELPDSDPDDGCRVERHRWAGDAPVEFYRIKGGGHTWPGGAKDQPEAMIGKTCWDIDASALMWDFFEKQITSE